jgi:cysteine desulfurase
MMNRIYFDNAATTAMDPLVLESMMPYLSQQFGNASSIHSYGREARTAVEQSRKLLAEYLHVKPGELFFTGGGTESTTTVIHCAVRDLGVRHIITSPIEHHFFSHLA